MIEHMLKEYLIYDDLKFMPIDKYRKIEEQNKKIIVEIEKMRNKLNHDLYIVANNEFNRIINNIDIPFLRRLMYEQQINFNTYNNDFIDFSIDDDDFNLEQNILLRKLINHNKMRNLIKYLILKKYSKLINNDDNINTITSKLYSKLNNTNLDRMTLFNLQRILNDATNLTNSTDLQKGGARIELSVEYYNIILVCICLNFYSTNKSIYELCRHLIATINKRDITEGIFTRMDQVIRGSYGSKILLSSAVVQDNIEYSLREIDGMEIDQNIIKKYNDEMLNILTQNRLAVQNESELLKTQNLFLTGLPYYLLKSKQEASIPKIDERTIEKIMKPLEKDKNLKEKLKVAFEATETDPIQEGILPDPIQEPLPLQLDAELEKIKEELESSRVRIAELEEKLQAQPIEAPAPLLLTESANNEEKSIGDILEELKTINSDDVSPSFFEGHSSSLSTPVNQNIPDLPKHISDRATKFGYVIGANFFSGMSVIPRKNKANGYTISARCKDKVVLYSSFFFQNGIEVVFIDEPMEDGNGKFGKNPAIFYYLTVSFSSYRDAYAMYSSTHKDKNFPNPFVYKCMIDSYSQSGNVDVNNTDSWAKENGYKGGKKWSCAKVKPIDDKDRKGFMFQNGITVLYCVDDGNPKIIYKSPKNKKEFTNYHDAYEALLNEDYTGVHYVSQKFRKLYSLFIKKIKWFWEWCIYIYDIVKMTGGIIWFPINWLVVKPSKTFYYGYCWVRDKPKKAAIIGVSAISALTITYFFPGQTIQFVGWLLYNLGYLIYFIGKNFLEMVLNIGWYAISNVASYIWGGISTFSLESYDSILSKDYFDYNYTTNFLPKILEVFNLFGTTPPIDWSKNFYDSTIYPTSVNLNYLRKKYLKYKKKYLELK